MAEPRHSDSPVRETATEARAGSTPGVARNVLVIGTLLLTACAGGPATKKQQHYSKGTHYLAAGEYNEAVLEFRTALQVDPGFADAHHQLGLTYWHKGWIPADRTVRTRHRRSWGSLVC